MSLLVTFSFTLLYPRLVAISLNRSELKYREFKTHAAGSTKKRYGVNSVFSVVHNEDGVDVVKNAEQRFSISPL